MLIYIRVHCQDEEEGNGPKSIVVKGGDAESDSNENSDTGGAKNEETDNTNVEAPPLIPDLLVLLFYP